VVMAPVSILISVPTGIAVNGFDIENFASL
jgi:hypothetical protein